MQKIFLISLKFLSILILNIKNYPSFISWIITEDENQTQQEKSNSLVEENQQERFLQAQEETGLHQEQKNHV